MKYLIYILFLIGLISCNSVQKNRRHLETKISTQHLKNDIDFAYVKLQKFHPNLYWYITKEHLDYKIDSLKNSITEPLTPNQFYFRFAPVIASVKEGHLKLNGISKKYTQKEQKEFKNKTPLFGLLKLIIIDDKIYVKENKDSISNIKQGTEIIKINDDNVSELIKKYRKQFASDGENKTFQKYFINLAFLNYYTLENGLLDELTLTTKFENQIETVKLKRENKPKEKKEKKKKDIQIIKNQDYNENTKSYNRVLKFYNDSTIAYIKIKSFSSVYSSNFYKESFKKIKTAKTKYLIIDVRDNLGGSLSEINTLYSYLTDQDFTLIKKPEISFRTSALHQNYFRNKTVFSSIIKAPFYPFFLLFNYSFTKKENENFVYNLFSSKKTEKKDTAFDGEVFVLTNGASFSASSILSAKLKHENRALIIGEETGGTNDGTVAGVYNTITLPHSKLNLPIGLMLIQPDIEFENKNRGVIPHIEVETGFEKFLDTKDNILDFTLDYIKKKQ